MLYFPDMINKRNYVIVTLGSAVAISDRPAHVKHKVIPHGFFDLSHLPLQTHHLPSGGNTIIVGSHSSWGEMRSVETALALIKAIIACAKLQGCKDRIIGYIGGTGIDFDAMKDDIKLIHEADCAAGGAGPDCWKGLVNDNEIFGSTGDWLGKRNFDVTFNFQMYHYRDQVRLVIKS
jgi:hypothetical protein